MSSGILFVIATPLGNPGDLAPRAVESLRALDVLYAEDTRSAQQLLAAHGLRVPVRSCFDANEEARAEEAATRLREGHRVGLVSEAGTPAISDPGYRLVRAAIDAGARVVPVPGPSALLAALVASGLPPAQFFFGGFPPRKPGARRALFASLRTLPATLVFYESPVRVAETLTALQEELGDRPACVARELTKTHEELVRGRLSELRARYHEQRPLGEVTLVVGGVDTAAAEAPAPGAAHARAASLLASGLSRRDAADQLAVELNLARKEAYRHVLEAAEKDG